MLFDPILCALNLQNLFEGCKRALKHIRYGFPNLRCLQVPRQRSQHGQHSAKARECEPARRVPHALHNFICISVAGARRMHRPDGDRRGLWEQQRGTLMWRIRYTASAVAFLRIIRSRDVGARSTTAS